MEYYEDDDIDDEDFLNMPEPIYEDFVTIIPKTSHTIPQALPQIIPLIIPKTIPHTIPMTTLTSLDLTKISGKSVGKSKLADNELIPINDAKLPKQKTLLQFFKGTNIMSSSCTSKSKVIGSSHHVIDPSAIKTYIYPINYPRRQYQFAISHTSLFKNTLVCLPTGLGKTFIAAVVMYNYYRWFPDSKIVFLAPTKPLDDTVELTGTVASAVRQSEWAKRVLFMTPQTFRNDVQNDLCPTNTIVLVVFDEAHKASGNYAYCEIIKELYDRKAIFRVLALSATPGSDLKKVQDVVDNLMIERLELRTEESADVVPYIFNKDIKEIVVQPTQILKDLVADFCALISPILKTLTGNRAYYSDNPMIASSYGLRIARDKWRATIKRSVPNSLGSKIEGSFGIAINLTMILSNLINIGVRNFYDSIMEISIEVKQKANPSKMRLEFVKEPLFTKLLDKCRHEISQPEFSSHPKLNILVELVSNHFKTHALKQAEEIENNRATSEQSKVMIFSSFRSTVDEIVEILNTDPLIRPVAFIGQATGKTVGLKQKQQLRVIEDFMSDVYNVIVSTSIGEEGLDIGDIDLIICFDVHKSPVRMLQRCGRTGRKRAGNVILLLNPGADELSVQKARSQYKNVQRVITDGKKLKMYDGELSGVIPSVYSPVAEEKVFEVTLVEAKKTVPMKRSNSSRQSAFLDPAQEKAYKALHFKSKDSLQKLRLDAYPHWQTQQLSKQNITHSSISLVFTELMASGATLKASEEQRHASSPAIASPISQPIAYKKSSKYVIKELLTQSDDLPLCSPQSSVLSFLAPKDTRSHQRGSHVWDDHHDTKFIIENKDNLRENQNFKDSFIGDNDFDDFDSHDSYQETSDFKELKNNTLLGSFDTRDYRSSPIRYCPSPFLHDQNNLAIVADIVKEISAYSIDLPIPDDNGNDSCGSSIDLAKYDEVERITGPLELSVMTDHALIIPDKSNDNSIHLSTNYPEVEKKVFVNAEKIVNEHSKIALSRLPDQTQIDYFSEFDNYLDNNHLPDIESMKDRCLKLNSENESFMFDEYNSSEINAINALENEIHRTPQMNFSPTLVNKIEISKIASLKSNLRCRRIIHDSSSPQIATKKARKINLTQQSPTCSPIPSLQTRKTPLLERLQRKKIPRQAPMERKPLESSIMKFKKDRRGIPFKIRSNSTKNLLAAEFVDIEVSVSSDMNHSSDTDGSHLDQDLSGFIASTHATPENLNYYRRTLLDSDQKGLNKINRSKFRLAELGPRKVQVDEDSENPSSLVDFVCDDNQVAFQTQPQKFFDDEDESSIIYMDENINLDELGACDMLESE